MYNLSGLWDMRVRAYRITRSESSDCYVLIDTPERSIDSVFFLLDVK